MKLKALKMAYTSGPYNKCNEDEQWIRVTDGCPNQCEYCYCPPEINDYGIPEIVRNKVRIMDMNLLAVDKNILLALPIKLNKKIIHYEMICGVDYRLLDIETAELLYKLRFGRFNKKGRWQRSIRIAWDGGYYFNEVIKNKVDMLIKAGFKPVQIEVFMICDWKITFNECCMKLDTLKELGCLVNDCWFDNVKPPNYQCNYWTLEQCKSFRKECRKHNLILLFRGYDRSRIHS